MSTQLSTANRRESVLGMMFPGQVEDQAKWMKKQMRWAKKLPEQVDRLAERYIEGLVHGGLPLDQIVTLLNAYDNNIVPDLQRYFATACFGARKYREDCVLPGMDEPWFETAYATARRRQPT